MRIGFDGKRVVQNFTGLGNYSRYVLNILTGYFPENPCLVYTAKIPDEEQRKKAARVEFKHPYKKKFASLWRTFSIVKDLKKDKIDVYHGLSNEIPSGLRKAGISSVVTIHDLIFLRYPQYYKFIDRTIYFYKFRYACRNADQIIAISEQTKRDIIRYFKIPGGKVHVIYQNCNNLFSEKFSPEGKKKIRELYNLPARYLLNVGTVEPRKNLMLIAKALNEVPEHMHLVVVGRETHYAAEVKKYLRSEGLSERVLFLHNVESTDLPGIYQLAELFVYPSKFEGFGIPVIEAMHCGVPVIAATGSCLEEAGGPDSLYINPEDEVQLAQTINYLLDTPLLRQTMTEKGYNYVKKFDDRSIAEDLMTIYQKAIGTNA